MTVKIYAHRGSSAAFAEHTRAAYLQALADGSDGVECDIHLTADGHLVLLHDDTVDRTSDGTGAVAELTLAQLRELDFSSWHGAPIPAEYGDSTTELLTFPELLDLLADAGRAVELAVEFKYGTRFEERLVDVALETLRRYGWDPETSLAGNILVSFMSFHPAAVQYLADRVPSPHLCQLLELVDLGEVSGSPEVSPAVDHSLVELMTNATELGEKLIDDGVAKLAGPGVEYLRANPGNGARWVGQGKVLRVWTVDSAEDLALCRGLGVQQVTTNRPREIRELLAAPLDVM